MGRTQFLIFIMLFPVLVTYNNCSRSSGDTLASSVSESFLPGSSGAITRGDFEFFEPNPGCDEEKGAPASVLSVNAVSKNSVLQEGGCGGDRDFDVDFSALQMQNHNAYIVFYDNRIFASPFLHQGIDGHTHYREYCFNKSREMDFTIQYIETIVPGMTQPLEQFVGITMMGAEATLPGIQFNGGYLEVSIDGAKHFEAMNGAFDFYMNKAGSDGLKKAIYEDRSGNQIPMTCWYYKP